MCFLKRNKVISPCLPPPNMADVDLFSKQQSLHPRFIQEI